MTSMGSADIEDVKKFKERIAEWRQNNRVHSEVLELRSENQTLQFKNDHLESRNEQVEAKNNELRTEYGAQL